MSVSVGRSIHMRIRPIVIISAIVIFILGVGVLYFARTLWYPLYLNVVGRETVASRIAHIDATRKIEIESLFTQWPPQQLTLIAYKQECELELWEPGRRVAVFPILAASGKAGPKLRRGDRQVPEGIYPIESLNPNSAYHLALRVGYPSAFDREQAARDGRTDLGDDIMIHGGAASIGCIAIGDPAIEVVFKAVAACGESRTTALIAPQRALPLRSEGLPAWVPSMYAELYRAIAGAVTH